MPEINFFWDPLSDNILQERDETGAITAEYTTEPGLYGNLISQNRQGVESQYHFDALGSTLALTDDNQQITDTNAYTAFGEVTEYTGSTVNPFQYIGQKGYYRDTETGNYDVRRRTLSPLCDRWLSTDPLYRGEINLYAYVGGRPTFVTDPSGTQMAPPPQPWPTYPPTTPPVPGVPPPQEPLPRSHQPECAELPYVADV